MGKGRNLTFSKGNINQHPPPSLPQDINSLFSNIY